MSFLLSKVNSGSEEAKAGKLCLGKEIRDGGDEFSFAQIKGPHA